jgi:hypothetical protein
MSPDQTALEISCLKIFFHDFGAYPFFFPWTEQLAHRGHAVTHAYVNILSIERNAVVSDLTPHHQRLPLKMPGEYHRIKYSFTKRFRMEWAYPKRSHTFSQGKSGGWKNAFDKELKDLFKEVMGYLLIRFGYEKDHNW